MDVPLCPSKHAATPQPHFGSSGMTADTPLTSFDNAPSVLSEWNSLSEEAQIKEQEDLTEYLKNPDTLTKFIEACRDIRRTVDVDIEGGFRVVFQNLLGFVGRYGEDFPAVERRYVHGWVRLIDVSESSTPHHTSV